MVNRITVDMLTVLGWKKEKSYSVNSMSNTQNFVKGVLKCRYEVKVVDVGSEAELFPEGKPSKILKGTEREVERFEFLVTDRFGEIQAYPKNRNQLIMLDEVFNNKE